MLVTEEREGMVAMNWRFQTQSPDAGNRRERESLVTMNSDRLQMQLLAIALLLMPWLPLQKLVKVLGFYQF